MGLFSTQVLEMKSLLIHKHILEKRIDFFLIKMWNNSGNQFLLNEAFPPHGESLQDRIEVAVYSFCTGLNSLFTNAWPDIHGVFSFQMETSIWTVFLIYQPSNPNHSFWNICSSPKTCKASVNIVFIRKNRIHSHRHPIHHMSILCNHGDLIEPNNTSLSSALDLHVRSI